MNLKTVPTHKKITFLHFCFFPQFVFWGEILIRGGGNKAIRLVYSYLSDFQIFVFCIFCQCIIPMKTFFYIPLPISKIVEKKNELLFLFQFCFCFLPEFSLFQLLYKVRHSKSLFPQVLRGNGKNMLFCNFFNFFHFCR